MTPVFRSIVVVALFLTAATTGLAKDRPLPPPQKDGSVSLERALAQRRSVRSVSEEPISAQQLSQSILWAAQGVTDERGHRTSPSARATYPLDLHVLVRSVEGLRPGHYAYVPESHALRALDDSKKDPVAAFLSGAKVAQDWPQRVPVALVVVGAPGRTAAKLGDRAEEFARLEGGLAAQSALLQVTAIGLASTFVGGFDPTAAREALGEASDRIVLAVLPIGRAAKK